MLLAEDMKNLSQAIVDSYEARIESIAAIRKETSRLLKGFQAARKEMSAQQKEMRAQLKDALAKGEVRRLKDFEAVYTEIKRRVATLKKQTVDLLRTLQAGRRSRASEVHKLLGSYRKDRAEAAAAWHELAVTMQKRRAEVTTKTAVSEEGQKIQKGARVIRSSETAERPSVQGEIRLPTFEDKVLSLVKEHRKGLKLADIEKITGKPRAKLGETMKSLVAKGKVEKKGSLYVFKK